MRAFLKALVLLPIAIAVILLSVANRGPVTLSFDPVSGPGASQFTVTIPIFALIFACVAAGVLIGGIAAWLVQGKHRAAERHYKREAKRLKAEMQHAGVRTGVPATTVRT